MRIIVNGEVLELSAQISLEQLVAELNLAQNRLAIERNGEVVRRGDWPNICLTENDRIEIVHFVGGG